MNPFIRYFNLPTMKTENVENGFQANTVFNVNKLNNNFSILHANIRSLHKNFDDLLVFLSHFDQKFHCIVLSETFDLRDKDMQSFNIPGYHIVYNESSTNKNGGCVMYIHNELIFNSSVIKLSDIKMIKTNLCNVFGLSVTVLATYRPPSTCPVTFNKHLENFLATNGFGDINFLVGDINIDICSELDEANEYLNIMYENGYKSCINDFTRIKNNSKSCIDHIFIKSKFNMDDFLLPVIIQSGITDHFIVTSQLVFKTIKNDSKLSKQRTIKYVNNAKLKSAQSSISWNFICGRNIEATGGKIVSSADDTVLLVKGTSWQQV